MHQDSPITRPSTQQDTPITGPSTHQDSPITRPCSRAQSQINDPPQNLAKPSRQSYIPTLQHPAVPSCHAATHCPANRHPPSTSHIPTPHHNPFPRPINSSSNPFSRPINHSASPITRPSASTPDDIYQFLTNLTALNGYPPVQQEAGDPIPQSMPHSSAEVH